MKVLQLASREARDLVRSINLHNLYVIESLHDDQKGDVPLPICCLNVQSLGNKAIPVSDYMLLQDIDVLGLT